MKRLLVCVFTAFVILAGCKNKVSSPGTVIRSGLPEKSNTILDMWPEAGRILFEEGRPVDEDTYTVSHRIAGDGILVIEVKSHDFDPIAALIDGEGNLIAFNDDWEQTSNTRLVVEDIPAGARLLVFSPDDSRGLYDVLIEEGTPRDLEEFIGGTDLNSGAVTGWIDDDRYDVCLDRILGESFGDDVYVTNFPQARLYSFSMEEEDLVSLRVESDDFDTYLILAEINNDEYRFIEYCDDYSGSGSRIITNLDPGRYIAIVMPYDAGYDGRFTLYLETLDEECLITNTVEAEEPGRTYSADIIEDRNFAIGFWPGMEDSWEIPGFLTPFSPVAGFEFSIEVPSIYEVSAFGEMDVCLTLLGKEDDSIRFVSSNDDYGDLGSDSRVIEPLFPGEYIGLVSLYSGAGEAEVSFSWQEAEASVDLLREGRIYSEFLSIDTKDVLYRLDLSEDRLFSISAESDSIDPMVTLVLGDGTRLTDDDGGDGTNALLHFSVNSDQSGVCFLIVSKFSGGEGIISVLLEETDRPSYSDD